MNSSILFVGCLAGALVICARNQALLTQIPSPRSIAWARCSRQLCVAAFWAAIATGITFILQGLMMLPELLGDNQGGSPARFSMSLMSFANIGGGAATLVSMLIALKAVSTLVPKFSMGALVSVEPSDAEPRSDNR